ncbi:HDOD domain-containing protein [Desulfovibrio sp. OttesenSCG-928-O18]|nr:HDOD domain-containing protein [Desulfovibrio sp. OttesenSCG-928-O18]
MKTRHEKAQSFLATLAESSPELPFEPTLLPELFASTADSSMSSTAHIANLVERSQGLAARILRLANSAYYGMQTAVSSLPHAIRLLGLNEVRNIILQIGVSSMIRKLDLPKSFPFKELWEHQILTASLAKTIARSMPHVDTISPDELYTAGLLHDIGKTLLAANRPEDWNAIHDLAVVDNIPFYRAEEDYWGIDHSMVGARLLTFWGLPQKLTELVNWHHFPQHAQEPFTASAFILATANVLSHYQLKDIVLEPKDENENPSLVLPKDAQAYIPETADQAKLLANLADCYDMDRVGGMAAASMEE